MSYKRYEILTNGESRYKHIYYECDECFEEIDEMHPRYSCANNTIHFCPSCALKLAFVSGDWYLQAIGVHLENTHAGVDPEGDIKIWSGNPTPPWEREEEQQRRTPEYIAWRQSVYERDNYTCQDCGQRGGELNAHHVKSFKDHPELRTKLRNGVTLCVECHRKKHKN